MERAGVEPGEVDEVILGQVLTAAQGQNPARQAAMNGRHPRQQDRLRHQPALRLRPARGGARGAAGLSGESEIVVAGGQESMTQAPHAAYLRSGVKMGELGLVDTMMKDGLWDAFHGYHMGTTAENVARAYQITREQQDEFAVASPEQGERGAEGRPLQGRDRAGHREGPQGRHGGRRRRIHPPRRQHRSRWPSCAPPSSKDGTVTAGNASGINDGAAALVVMSAEEARAPRPQAARAHRVLRDRRRRSGADGHGADPVLAARRSSAPAGRSSDLDLVEANEAFAAQACAVNKDLGWDPAKVNVNGGAIALGHPIGASGARVLVTLLHEMQRRDAKKGLATLCIGGGMGVAMCVER